MSRALVALLCAFSAARVLARDATSVLDNCIAQLDPGRDVGYERIAARCPDLASGLMQSPWAAWLPHDWDKPGNNLSASGLQELRWLISGESQRAPGTNVPQPAHVAAVLAALAPAQSAQPDWWQRVRGWLREMLSVRESAGHPGWLARALDALKTRASLVRIVSLGALALAALLAAAIVLRELRAAGLLRIGQRARRAPGGAASVGAAADLGFIEAAAPGERPRLLLELIAARLAALERLPPARALTLRELQRAARLADASDRARLAELAQACERLRFSGRGLPPEALDAALAQGRELLGGLGAARA